MGQAASSPHGGGAAEADVQVEPSMVKRKLFERIDTNKSGTIEFAEFVAVMLQLGLHHATIAQWWQAATGSQEVLTLDGVNRCAQRFPKEVRQAERLFAAAVPTPSQLRTCVAFHAFQS